MNNIKIPYKDPQVKFIWDCWEIGACTYDQALKAEKVLLEERINKLKENGLSDNDATDVAIKETYALDLSWCDPVGF